MPGTAAESGLRVKSRTALPSVDFTPIWLTQVYQKGDKNLLFQVHFGLWACRSHWERVLCCSVSSYRNADSVSPLICNTFCFPCKKKKMFFAFYPVKIPLLSIACFPIFTVLYCYSFLQNGANCCLSSCFLTALHTDHLLLHLQRVRRKNVAPMNSTNSCLLEADRKCLINILWPGFGCISQIVSCNVLSTPPRGAFSFLLFWWESHTHTNTQNTHTN